MSVFQLILGKCDSIYIPFFRQTDHRHCTLAKVIHLVGVKFPVSFHFCRLTSITTRPTTRSRLTSIVPLFRFISLLLSVVIFHFFAPKRPSEYVCSPYWTTISAKLSTYESPNQRNVITWLIAIAGGAGKARFNVATPTYEARTRPLHVQHTYYRIIFKQNPFNIISRGVQRWTSTDFRLK